MTVHPQILRDRIRQDPDDIDHTWIGEPCHGADSFMLKYQPWIRAHLLRGRRRHDRYNADDYRIEGELFEWTCRSNMFRPEERKRLDAYGIRLLNAIWVGHDYPDLLALYAPLTIWISSIDDKVLEAGRPSAYYLATCPDALRHGVLPDRPDHYHYALQEIHQQFLDYGAEAHLPEVTQSIVDWLGGCATEQSWRDGGRTPTVGEYLANRQKSIGAYPMHTGIRLQPGMLAPGLPVPVAIAQLRWLICRLVGVENDLYSSHKEAWDGTDLTLINVLKTNYRIDTDQAVACAMAISAALRDEHDQLVAAILDDSTLSPEAHRFTEYLSTLVDGQIEWAFATSRYGIEDRGDRSEDLTFPAPSPSGCPW